MKFVLAGPSRAKELAAECIRELLEADVIQCTIGVMRQLQASLRHIQKVEPGGELCELMLRMTSESIREALHRGELPITNDIIAAKNRILKDSGVEVPEGHEVIDGEKYGSYWW